jgi:hypothetical protein
VAWVGLGHAWAREVDSETKKRGLPQDLGQKHFWTGKEGENVFIKTAEFGLIQTEFE